MCAANKLKSQDEPREMKEENVLMFSEIKINTKHDISESDYRQFFFSLAQSAGGSTRLRRRRHRRRLRVRREKNGPRERSLIDRSHNSLKADLCRISMHMTTEHISNGRLSHKHLLSHSSFLRYPLRVHPERSLWGEKKRNEKQHNTER